MKFKAVTPGSHYLGGFIGSDHDIHAWLNKVSTWEHAIGELSMAATKYPQTA
jgi:hypothetical protein